MTRKTKRYEAMHNGRKVRVTVPENNEADIFEAIREQLSPHAVAAIAAVLQTNRTNNPEVDREVAWFHEQLAELVGGHETLSRLGEELGL